MKNFTRRALTVQPYSVLTVDFNGTYPNYFRVNNGGANRIYAGITSIPSRRLYDFAVEAGQVRMYCTDKGYPKLFIFNPGGSAIDIIVSSFNDEFSPEVLAFTDFNIADNEDTSMTVEIGGFTEPLPSGTNNIGVVSLSAADRALLEELQQVVTLKTGYGSANQTFSEDIAEIVFFSNDGENDMTITIGSETITVKAGEVLNHLKCSVSSVTVTATEAWRIAYNVY